MFDKVVFHIFSICQLLKMDIVYSYLYYLLLGFGWFLEQCMGNDVRTHKFLVAQIKATDDHKEFMKSYKTNNQTQNIKYLLRTKPLNIHFHVQKNLVGSDPVVSEPRWEAILNFQKKIWDKRFYTIFPKKIWDKRFYTIF